MFPRTIKSWLVILVVLIGAVTTIQHRSAQKRLTTAGPIAEQPQQENKRGAIRQLAGYQIEPVADYAVRARVLSVERYRMGREADLSPVDFVLGWGPMSDASLTNQLDISQGNRWYQYRWQGAPPIDPAIIVRTSANTHMVPADDTIKSQLLNVRQGDTVILKGYLINVEHPDGWRWRTSLSREDSGGGSCELLWVESVRVE